MSRETERIPEARPGADDSTAWAIDPERSRLEFSVKHLMVATVHGRFRDFEGVLSGAHGAPDRASGTVSAASIDTGDRKRDERLLDSSFLDAEQHPLIRLGRCRIETEDGRFRATGELTIKAVTQPLTFEGTLEPLPDDELRIVARGELSRRAYDLSWAEVLEASGAVVSDRVRIELEMVARRAGG